MVAGGGRRRGEGRNLANCGLQSSPYNTPMSCWQTLGIAPTTDETLIKQAYAARIREHRPDRDPAGFRRVRTAYEEALEQCASVRVPPGNTATPPAPVESLREPENTAYFERPAGREREPVAHSYLDRPAASGESPAALLAWLQTAWASANSDGALLLTLQKQAATVATQNIDFRLDYTTALQTLLADADFPDSRDWVQTHYLPIPGNDRHRLAESIRRDRNPAARDALLARYYPALAAWLQQGALRRWWQLRRDWLLRHDSGLVWRDWQQLRHASGDIPPAQYAACWPPLAALLRNPTPRAVPWPWLLMWFALANVAAVIIQSRQQYAALLGLSPVTVLMCAFWLPLLGGHILLRAKCAISLAWPPPPVPRDRICGFAIACLLLASLPQGGFTLARTLALCCGQFAIILCWLRLPASDPAARHDFLNDGAASIIASLVLYGGSEPFNQHCAPFLNLLCLSAFTLRRCLTQQPHRPAAVCLLRLAVTLANLAFYLLLFAALAQLILLGMEGSVPLAGFAWLVVILVLVIFHYAT